MTRKRFVKLLMAEGYSRNSANDIADECLEDGYSYAEGYYHVIRLLPLVKAMAGQMADAVKKATEAIGRLITAVGEAASAAMSQTWQKGGPAGSPFVYG